MASYSSVYIKKEILEVLLKTVNAKQEKGVEITVSLNDEKNQYGQDVSAYVSQTKEQRDKKKPRYYVGNGKTFWRSDANAPAAAPEPAPSSGEKFEEAQVVEEDDLPF
jgi:chitinase